MYERLELPTRWTGIPYCGDGLRVYETAWRLQLGQGLTWQADPDALSLNDTVDAKDVYFTLFCNANFTGTSTYDWIDDMEIVDDREYFLTNHEVNNSRNILILTR